jgi:hypothetical protein
VVHLEEDWRIASWAATRENNPQATKKSFGQH